MELTDLSPMPFGKHKGIPMQDVPAAWLHWLWSQPGNCKRTDCPVINYIRENLEALKKEHKDGIW